MKVQTVGGTRLVIQWVDQDAPEVLEFWGENHGDRAIAEQEKKGIISINEKGHQELHFPGQISHVFIPIERNISDPSHL